MKFIIDLLIEPIVVAVILVIQYFRGVNETVFLFRYGDIGEIILTFGVLWGLGTLFRLTRGWGATFISLICACFVFLFGHALNEYGLFTAFCFMGCFSLVAAYVSSPFCKKATAILFSVGICLLLIGYPNTKLDKPTKIPDQPHRIVDTPNAEWYIRIEYDRGFGREKDRYEFSGTEEEAIQQASLVKDKWKSENKDDILYGVGLICINIPEWYQRKYGWPERPQFVN